ncbi:MAG: glycosyltransferase family 2 protein, partial [Candidatus Binatia bacterium]
MNLSVVVPVYNEEENLEPLTREVIAAVQPLGEDYELIMVDDGSTDRSFHKLSNIHREDPRIKILRLSRNFGQTAALAAGISYAKGDVIVFMDGDGQNDPKDIPVLLNKIREGFDLVTGW